jgi:hypothetical protein
MHCGSFPPPPDITNPVSSPLGNLLENRLRQPKELLSMQLLIPVFFALVRLSTQTDTQISNKSSALCLAFIAWA